MKRGKPKKRTSKIHTVPKRSPDVFDEGEKLIKKTKAWLDTRAQSDPQWAANYARQLLEIGTETLLTLIESKKLTDPRGSRDDAESSKSGSA